MIKLLKQVFEDLGKSEASAVDQKSIELCSFSLMAITASSDSTFDEDEQATILALGERLFSLDRATAQSILDEARQEADISTSLYEFTSLVHEHMSEPEKFQLVKGLWSIAYADGRIDKYEEHIIRRIAELIYLDHARFTEAKFEAKNSSS